MSRRLKQINQAMRREISELIARRINDPRIKGIVSVTEVEVSRDLAQAKVFISFLGTDEEKVDLFHGLEAASGFIRREVGGSLKLRFIPQLIFLPDDSIERGRQLLQLIDQVISEESQPGT